MSDKHTPGPLRLGIWPADWDHVESFRENLKYGSGPVWMVIAPDHPLSVGGWDDNSSHAVTTCITGNGPASEANAKLYAAAPELLEACEELHRHLSATCRGVAAVDDVLDAAALVIARARGGA